MPKIYSRRKGADPIPPDAVYVGRGTPWGNPYQMSTMTEAERTRVCDSFESKAEAWHAADPSWLAPLRGKSLVCWCQSPKDKRPKRCHAETLIRLANQ